MALFGPPTERLELTGDPGRLVIPVNPGVPYLFTLQNLENTEDATWRFRVSADSDGVGEVSAPIYYWFNMTGATSDPAATAWLPWGPTPASKWGRIGGLLWMDPALCQLNWWISGVIVAGAFAGQGFASVGMGYIDAPNAKSLIISVDAGLATGNIGVDQVRWGV